jgi:phosphoribosyl 1,2-cyclic phosphodiesterase
VSKSKDGHTGATWFSAQALRFTGKEKAPSQAHARKKKIDHHEAKRRLEAAGIDFSCDSDELRMSEAQLVADTAREAGYRKRKDAPGSTSRMYFQHLKRLRNHATRGKHTIYDLVEVNKRTKQERVLHRHFSTKADAQEAANEYKERKRPDVTYRIKPRKITASAYRWNPED